MASAVATRHRYRCARATVALLPAEGTLGELVWTAMGTDTVPNLRAQTYSATLMAALLSKGALCCCARGCLRISWRSSECACASQKPQLAFLHQTDHARDGCSIHRQCHDC